MAQTDVTVIYETVHGSRAYGLATETSDTDLRGVFVPPPLAFTGFVAQPDQIERAAEPVLYEIDCRGRGDAWLYFFDVYVPIEAPTRRKRPRPVVSCQALPSQYVSVISGFVDRP